MIAQTAALPKSETASRANVDPLARCRECRIIRRASEHGERNRAAPVRKRPITRGGSGRSHGEEAADHTGRKPLNRPTVNRGRFLTGAALNLASLDPVIADLIDGGPGLRRVTARRECRLP